MLRDRLELENNLQEAIERIKYKRKNIEQVNKALSKFNVPAGFFNEVSKNYGLLNELELGLLCLLTDAVFDIDGGSQIRKENYFTDGEIKSAQAYKYENEPDVKLPIVLEDVIKIDYDRYITKIQMSELVKWQNSNLIVYDSETQRGLQYVRSRDGVVPVPIVNKESVVKIADYMKEDSFFTDTIRINCYSDDVEPVSYNPKTRKLVINEGATISILDGFHRLQGAVRAYSSNPELSLVQELSICVYDTETAKKFFAQINKYNPIDPARLESLDEEKVSFAAVKQLKLHSDLKGRISIGSKVSKLVNQLTTESILAEAIEEVFEPKTTPQANAVGQYLTEFFNYLLQQYRTEFNSNDSIMKHPRMFIAYIVFAKQFKDYGIGLEKLPELINGLKLENSHEIKEVVTNNRGTSARLQKHVREYFEKIDVRNYLK